MNFTTIIGNGPDGKFNLAALVDLLTIEGDTAQLNKPALLHEAVYAAYVVQRYLETTYAPGESETAQDNFGSLVELFGGKGFSSAAPGTLTLLGTSSSEHEKSVPEAITQSGWWWLCGASGDWRLYTAAYAGGFIGRVEVSDEGYTCAVWFNYTYR
jgi:hypothetical protein